ncbi:MAG: L-aspartate oxidase [Gammaproteobacteria bacterium PRO9]|nr:L-aspartate oxidase [Gammaproteobacteria bacterium PRO9]
MTPSAEFDVLVLGGGLGGFSTALRLADAGVSVGLLRKRPSTESSSAWAQGGIAAAIAAGDSPEQHAADTQVAGAGLCNPATVQMVTWGAPDAIRWLQGEGVEFTRESTDLHLTREGGHSLRRVVHADDATGRAVIKGLEARVNEHSRIRVLDDRIAIDLITSQKQRIPGPNRCVGVYALNRGTGLVETIAARITVLATGGASKVYLYTTNPDTSTGDGIAMAWRAGCRVANLEFVQFHPTCLFHPLARSELMTEAIRGEGGVLRLPDGTRFMEAYDPRAELAPRDIVARAIDAEMKRGGHDCVYLDISHKPAAEILKHFPNIAQELLKFGIDMTRQPIPVVPAAHYSCGGVVTDLDAATDLANLYAVGECTFTGLHGANRLASNSLLECLVFGAAAARSILSRLGKAPPVVSQLTPWDESRVTDPDELVIVSHNWEELRRCMWNYVGIVRTNKRLERARHRVDLLRDEIGEFYGNFRVTNDLIELRNLALVAELTILCAQARQESRGLHWNRDYPVALPDGEARNTVLIPGAVDGRWT